MTARPASRQGLAAGGDGAARALVALGSNIDPEQHLPQAIASLAERCRVLAVSSAFETAPVGPPGQPGFLNAAVLLATELSPAALKKQVLRPIEEALGRKRSADRFAPRTIDLDLVVFHGRVHAETMAPDPLIWRQLHLALPLAELAPELRHPASGESLAEASQRLRAATATTAYRRRPDVSLVATPRSASHQRT